MQSPAESDHLGILAGVGTKRCNACGQTLPVSEFHRHSTSRDGRQSKCKACSREYNAQRQRKKGVKPAGIDPQQAHDVMVNAGILPSIPYPGAAVAWPGVCLRCGHPVKPRYSYVVKGGGGCAYCAGKRLTDEVLAARAAAEPARCIRCEEVRPVEDFSPNPNVVGGRLRQCHSCVAELKAARWRKTRA